MVGKRLSFEIMERGAILKLAGFSLLANRVIRITGYKREDA